MCSLVFSFFKFFWKFENKCIEDEENQQVFIYEKL